MVELLLEARASVDARDGRDQTPLLVATRDGHPGIMRRLLSAGASPDASDRSGRTPLIWAAECGRREEVRMLIEAKASLNCCTLYGSTPLMMAVAEGHDEIAHVLVAAGASLAATDENLRTAADYTTRPIGAWLRSVHELGYNPAQVCSSLGNESLLRWALLHGVCDPNALPAGTPSLADLCPPADPSLLSLCNEIRLPWAPVRHRLFPPWCRSAVRLILRLAQRGTLAAREADPFARARLAPEWIGLVPREVWFVVCAHLGRGEWPLAGQWRLT